MVTVIRRFLSAGRRRSVVTAVCAVAFTSHTSAQNTARQLHDAVSGNNAQEVIRLLDSGAPVNSTIGDDKQTPLHRAIAVGNEEIIAVLLDRSAKVNAKTKDGVLPLHVAARQRIASIVELLLAKQADVKAKDDRGDTPLHHAARAGHRDVAMILIGAGADVNAKNKAKHDPLALSISGTHLDVAKLLLERGADLHDASDLLIASIKALDTTFARQLLARGANPTGRNRFIGRSTLQAAAESGDRAIIQMLLAEGGEADWALPVAVKTQNVGLIQLLLSNGAKPNPVFSGAVQTCNSEVVHLILDGGAKIDDAHTVSAVATCDVSVARLLLEKGANPNAQERGEKLALRALSDGRFGAVETEDPRGWTALGKAVARGDGQLVDLLLGSGADPNVQLIASTSDQSLKNLFHEALNSGPLHWSDAAMLAANTAATGNALTVDLGNGDYIKQEPRQVSAVFRATRVASWMVTKSRESLVTTPLILATRQKMPTLVERLLAAGADVGGTDEKGLTALEHAKELGHIEIQQLLKR